MKLHKITKTNFGLWRISLRVSNLKKFVLKFLGNDRRNMKFLRNKLNFPRIFINIFLFFPSQLITDYVTPPEKFFCRGLEAELLPAMEFLQSCRPFAVSMTNALRYIKLLISQEDSDDNDDDVSVFP